MSLIPTPATTTGWWNVVLGLLAGVVGLASTSTAFAEGFEMTVLSADVSALIAGGVAEDEHLVIDDGSGVLNIFLFGFPDARDVDGYHQSAVGGHWFTFDSTTSAFGQVVEPGDVISATAGLRFDASALGLARGVDVDAVSEFAGDMLLSFSTAVELTPGQVADDEDVVRYGAGTLHLQLDLSAIGVPPNLDLDALHLDEERGVYYLSFDGPGQIASLRFEGSDLLAYEPGAGWRMARRGRDATLPLPRGADLDGVFAIPGLFSDGFETGDLSRWAP